MQVRFPRCGITCEILREHNAIFGYKKGTESWEIRVVNVDEEVHYC